MSELQTFTVDSEAISLLDSVTSRESATDPEELQLYRQRKVRRRGGARSVVLCQITAHTQFIWIVRTCPAPMCELHIWALFAHGRFFYPDN
eukprot:scaffold146168_cov25-Attheya_sp.AAC.1